MKKALFSFVLLFCTICGFGQDLRAKVQLLTPKIQVTNKRTLEVLESAIREFLNNRKWVADAIKPQERIDCNFIINITEWDGSNNFKAEAQILSSRPIYNSTYNSTLLLVSDKNFDFKYSEGESLDFNEQTFSSNLTSLLAFYANIIAGMDYDSYASLGGTPYFLKAQTIANNAQNSSFTGWKAFEGLRNRYWIAENLNSQAYNPLRIISYNYHRLGLDNSSNDMNQTRRSILSSLSELSNLDRQKQGAILIQLFFSAKADEMINIFSKGNPQDKVKLYNILSAADPANISKYEVLKKGL